MIELTRTQQGILASFTTPQPCIYLDHCALDHLARDARLGDSFLDAFKSRGTVLISMANVFEIVKVSGNTADLLRRFLEQIGLHWFPISMDPVGVTRREENRSPDQPSPCAGEWFREILPKIEGPPVLPWMVDLTRDSEGQVMRAAFRQECDRILEALDEGRRLYQQNPRSLDVGYPQIPFDKAKPTRYIWNGLVRLAVKDRFRLTDQHVLDLFHAVVPLSHCSFVVLDKHWAEQARKLHLPREFVRIYDARHLDTFIADFARTPQVR